MKNASAVRWVFAYLVAFCGFGAAPSLKAQPPEKVSLSGSPTRHWVSLQGSRLRYADSMDFSQPSPFVAFCFSALGTGIPLGIGIARYEKDPTALPSLLIAGGLIVGPAMGYFYGGEWGRGFLGMGIRLGITGGCFIVMAAAMQPNSFALGPIVAIGVVGLAVVAIDALYDLFRVPSYISEQNAVRRVLGVNVAPMYSPATRSAGVQVFITL